MVFELHRNSKHKDYIKRQFYSLQYLVFGFNNAKGCKNLSKEVVTDDVLLERQW